eukprot:TRINITY_DN6616_c0_g1_i1.p1 TRINITY_DN6616_c0_g1~~TRINITY_DN6616_c0_g1_i1.p1  ORF type:complete len:380 (+),score=151.95 TRINITY_DN6616_c0_g1_i1:54-1193(+)
MHTSVNFKSKHFQLNNSNNNNDNFSKTQILIITVLIICLIFLIALNFEIVKTTVKVQNTKIIEENQYFNKLIEKEDVSDEITYVFGIFNINRRAHLGKSGSDYKFEDDYVNQVIYFLNFLKPYPTQIFLERKYYDFIKPHLHNRSRVIFHEVSDLRAYKYYDRIEKIRNSGTWTAITRWLASVPQGYSDLYNPIVMQKIYFLLRTARTNPFNTKYFSWLDSGGICSPTIRLYGKEYIDFKIKTNLDENKFFITRSPYRGAGEIHGCEQKYIVKLGIPAINHVCKGWIMGGTLPAIEKLYSLYDNLINTTLSLGCLGTEETIFSIAHDLRPDLFNAFNNSEPYNQWQDNVCKFFVEPKEDEEKRQLLRKNKTVTFISSST